MMRSHVEYQTQLRNWLQSLTDNDNQILHSIDNDSWTVCGYPGITTSHIRQIYLNLYYDDLTETQRTMVEKWLSHY